MRAVEVLIQLGELTPGRYEYDNPLSNLFGGMAALKAPRLQPFVENHHAEVHGKRQKSIPSVPTAT